MIKKGWIMYKKQTRVIILVVFSLSFLLISCSPSSTAVQNAIEQTRVFESQIQTAIAKTQVGVNQEIDQKPLPVVEIAPTPTTKPSPTKKPSPAIKPTDKPKTIDYNQVIKINNFCEFQMTNAFFANKILPPNTSGYYTYYESKSSDSTYLDVVFTIKNLDSLIKSAEDFISVKALYDNQFTYGSFAVLVGPAGDFNMGFYGIDPLMTGEVHHIITIPIEVENSSKPLVIILQVKDQEYHFVARY